MISDFILKIVVKEFIPKQIWHEFSGTSRYDYLIKFIKNAIKSSAFYIKGPEIFLRFFLFCLILLFKFLQIISFNLISAEFCLKKISQLHPILNDGVRLYVSLAMFAAFEDDSMRVNRGFPPIKDISKSFKKILEN